MKISITCLIFFAFNSILFSQDVKLNCIIFIDGKLPRGIFNEYFLCVDSSGDEKRIDFHYLIGDIQMSQENVNIIHLLNPEDDVIMNFSHKQYNGKTFNYSGALKVEWLNYSYLVIRITNINLKKGEYYFGYSTPGIIKKFIKKEYNMFEDYNSR